MSKPKKHFYEYISTDIGESITLSEYQRSPATAFLNYTIHAKNAMTMCQNKFKKSGGADFTKNALDNMRWISAGLLASIMGNFETYQKYLFGLMFEYSVYLDNLDLDEFFRKLKKECSVSIDINRFATYRDNPGSVGIILADNMSKWHNPDAVNTYFRAFDLPNAAGEKPNFYDEDSVNDLQVLWQMRHSIVHTAGTITIPDAYKVGPLKPFSGKVIALQYQFIQEVSRKFHPLVKKSTYTLRDMYLHNLKNGLPANILEKINNIFKVESTYSAWL